MPVSWGELFGIQMPASSPLGMTDYYSMTAAAYFLATLPAVLEHQTLTQTRVHTRTHK